MYDSYEVALMIRKAARDKEIPLKTLAEKSGIGRNFISHLTNGKSLASDSLASIADVLDVSMDYLMGRTDKPEINK